MKKTDLARLERNKPALLRWMCGIKSTEDASTQASLESTIRCRRLRCYGHTKRSSSWTLEIVWQKRRGRPRKTWSAVITNDFRVAQLSSEDAQDQDEWRKGVAKVHETSNTPEGGNGR